MKALEVYTILHTKQVELQNSQAGYVKSCETRQYIGQAFTPKINIKI